MWDEIIANKEIKNYLKDSIEEERISHAQLFIGKEGFGTFAMAWTYAESILCDGKLDCKNKIKHLQHPDLHLSFPTFNLGKTKALSENYIAEFRKFIKGNPYANIEQWHQYAEAGNKQGIISVAEIEHIIHKLSIKSYEGGYKILIMWHADKIHDAAANKFLKLLEEPPEKTLFILLSEKENLLLPTITSRCQTIIFKRLEDNEIESQLKNLSINETRIKSIMHQAEGDWNEALQLIEETEFHHKFEQFFVTWTRNAFVAKKNPKVLKNIITWSQEIGGWGRENQKNYLHYCNEIFRQALLNNYGKKELVFLQIKEQGFDFDKFSYFIHGNNVEEILYELNQASYHIERNANAKIVLLDLGIKLTRYIHRASN